MIDFGETGFPPKWVQMEKLLRALSSPKASAYRGSCATKSLGVPALRFRFGGDDFVRVKPLQSLRDSFRASGEATSPNCFRCRFPDRGVSTHAPMPAKPVKGNAQQELHIGTR
ncbi:hypothetical protein AEM38_08565 [Hyphomonadaceae bacterium UKL13-1]|nr:hypothetical protein AEM38_08565 [Hyphomonadaceae bacterium UKL13-1]